MRIILLLVAYCAGMALALDDVSTEDENIAKKDTFPYMAVLYYPDNAVVNEGGVRIVRAGTLIRTNWLISSTFENTNTDIGFPKKTLMARLGSIRIDVNFTLNEDENEQEREIIQITRPANLNITVWWYTDISLLKTLLHFNITEAVAPVAVSHKTIFIEISCFILLYIRTQNSTEDRTLVKDMVYMLPATLEKCGSNFQNNTMLCAAPSDEKSNALSDPNFCEFNRGGPLICNNELTGIQTYIENCNEPYVYQKVTAWDDLLSCAIEEKCLEEHCSFICSSIYKDTPVTTTLTTVVIVEKEIVTKAQSDETTVITLATPTLTNAEISTTEKTTTITTLIDTVPTTEKVLLTSETPNVLADSTSSSVTKNVELASMELNAERKTAIQAKRHRSHSSATLNETDLLTILTAICMIINFT